MHTNYYIARRFNVIYRAHFSERNNENVNTENSIIFVIIIKPLIHQFLLYLYTFENGHAFLPVPYDLMLFIGHNFQNETMKM